MMGKSKQPYIHSPLIDGLFILFPPFLCLIIIFLFPAVFQQADGMTTVAWVLLIVCIDVAHVYSTLYRTYFDKETMQMHKTALINIPLIAWVIFVIFYSIDYLLFWRILAYLAVFHFIRQQYGFLRIYSRNESTTFIKEKINTITIYTATLYPLLYWHLSSPRNFNWFVENDFIYFNSNLLSSMSFAVYILFLCAYAISEIIFFLRKRYFNLPRNLIIVGTVLSWYTGIVYFNGDLAFTTLNVVSHGLPYMALIWIYGRKKYVDKAKPAFIGSFFTLKGLVYFIGVIILLSFLEEGIWDAMIWNDHKKIFTFFSYVPRVTDNNLLAFIVPLLALPQITHYIIDGFIWKISKDNYNWKDQTLG